MIYSLTPKPQNPIIIQKYYIYSNSNLILYYNSNSNLILYYNIYYINFIYYGFWGFENLVEIGIIYALSVLRADKSFIFSPYR